MGPSLLLAMALAGLTHVQGVYKERAFTGACDREGVAAWEDRPRSGKRLFVRVAGDSPAPALAQAVSGEDGSFAMSFQPPAAGEYCVAHQGAERLVCLTSFAASPIEGSATVSIVLGPLGARPGCVSQRRKVRGQTRLVEEPCGDAGKPPRPLGGQHFVILASGERNAAASPDSDAGGRFEANLLPGRYCARAFARTSGTGQAAEGCLATFEVADRDVDGVMVDFRRTCDRESGRAAAAGGTLHVRGQVIHQTSYWGGAYRREPPPAVTTGNRLRVRPGDQNGPTPPVAEVVTDEHGFDVALPPGVWCMETAYHDEWFKGWASVDKNELDPTCMKQRYETCDYVARLGGADIENVVIRTVQWHPPSFPCRLRPYNGPSPP